MHKENHDIKTHIVRNALPDVPFEGWTSAVLARGAVQGGFSADMVKAVFPAGVKDALSHFALMADEAMLSALANVEPQSLKVRERVSLAVEKRLAFLTRHKEAERLAVAYWMRPFRKYEGAKIVWRTADAIWNWAGDTATDYNRYTKRALLSGVLTATVLFWMNEKGKDLAATKDFLARRIENVMTLGKMASSLKRAS